MQPNENLLRIAFITTVARNPGDAFIRSGIEYLIQQYIPHYHKVYVDKHEYRNGREDGDIAQQIVRKGRQLFSGTRVGDTDPFADVDLIVQAGAPLYYISPDQKGSYASFSSSVTTDWVDEVWLKGLLRIANPPPILNMAVGTCQPFHSDTSEFDHSPALLEFVRKTVELCALTTVRERVALQLLEKCGLRTYFLPCTAIFAADNHRIYPEQPQFVCLNFMPGGAHYTLGQEIDFQGWETTFRAIYDSLSKKHAVVVMCHSPSEVLKVRALLPWADTFFSPNYTDYLEMYAKARFGIFNRVHGAIALAGFGRPAVVVGNDTRALMGESMNLPTYFVNDATPEKMLEHCADFEKRSEAWSEMLLAKKNASRQQYMRLLETALGKMRPIVNTMAGYQRSDSSKVGGRR